MKKEKKSKHFSNKEILKYSWGIFSKNVWFFISFILVMFGVSYVTSLLDGVISYFAIISTILHLLVAYILLWVSLRSVQGEKLNYINIFDNFKIKSFLFYIIGSIIYMLVAFGGFVLLIVPGFVFMIALQFYTFAILKNDDLNPLEALKYSWDLTKGVRWKLLWFSIVLTFINIIGTLTLGLGLLITIPLTYLSFAYLFMKLDKQTIIDNE